MTATGLVRFGTFAFILLYLSVTGVAYVTSSQRAHPGMSVGTCAGVPCVSWVMPGGWAWDGGARPGMPVLSVDGRDLTASDLPAQPERSARVQAADGGVLVVEARQNPIGQSPMKFSLWLLSGMFAALGAIVLSRRPDLAAARYFGLLSGFAAIGLTVAPSAGGSAPVWALVVQIVALIGVSASFPPFVTRLLGASGWVHRVLSSWGHVAAGTAIVLGYGASVVFRPTAYDFVRPVVFLYISVSVLGAIGFLAYHSGRQHTQAARQQARLALWGIALSALPFIVLTLIPEALGRDSLLPVHLTILASGLMPAFFAYAILEHQLLGIRRLIHRGMVYTITTLILLVLVLAVLGFLTPFSDAILQGGQGSLIGAGILLVGMVLFFPLRRAAHRLVDSLLYRDVADYQAFLDVVDEHLLSSSRTSDIAQGIADRLLDILQLEAVLLFLGEDAARSQTVARAGPRAFDVLFQLHPQLLPQITRSQPQELLALSWQSESLLLAHLKLADRYLGYLLLGPKRGGEVFIDEERRLVATLVPVLALAVDKSMVSEELRVLNRRLLKAEERERARVAGDLHDGPLQKALLLTSATGVGGQQHRNIAQQLALELREICSRLRPAMLDDLGLVPALEWLLETLSRHSALDVHLSLHHVDEEERFPPDIELTLFRVTQEAANNVVKHASASSFEVSLAREGGTLVLRAVDNGCGFVPGGRNGGGFGISGMRERVTQVNGSFDVRSVPGEGTAVATSIPLVLEEERAPQKTL